MKRRAVFFDRDNTLIVSDGYLGDPAKVQLIGGAAQAVARARQLGYVVVTFSNQSGVARGLFEEKDVQAVNARMDQLLRTEDPTAIIDHHEFCPFHPQAAVGQYRQESDLRKPRPGMLHQAAQTLYLDLKQSWVVGDAPRDIEAGAAAGCRTILFADPAVAASPAATEAGAVQPEFRVSTLNGAIDVIEQNPARQDEPKPVEKTRLEITTEQILHELRRGNEAPVSDFSVTKLLAGMTQIIVPAALLVAYLYRDSPGFLQATLMVALILQTATIALLMMARSR